MANEFLESFEIYGGTSTSMTEGRWNSITADTLLDNSGVTARTGTWSLVVGGVGTANRFGRLYNFPANARRVFGFGFRTEALTNAARFWRAMHNVSGTPTPHFYLKYETDGTITIRNGNDTSSLGNSAAGVIVANTWQYIEVDCTISDTVGIVNVYVDGVLKVNLTNIDNLFSGGADTTGCDYFNSDTTQNHWFDDIYLDTNTVYGPVNVYRSKPTSDGATLNFTPSTGTDHSALVDEEPPNSDTDYNSSSTVNHIDTYNVTDQTFNGFVKAVQAGFYARKTDANTLTQASVIRLNGTDYVGGTKTLTTSYAHYYHAWDVSPDTSGAFSAAEINAMEVGQKIIAQSSTAVGRTSQVYAEIAVNPSTGRRRVSGMMY